LKGNGKQEQTYTADGGVGVNGNSRPLKYGNLCGSLKIKFLYLRQKRIKRKD